MINKIVNSKHLPEVVLMDINMTPMDGYQSTAWPKQHYPAVKVLALSMYEDEEAILK